MLVWFPIFFHLLHSCRAFKQGVSLFALYISPVNLHTGLYRPHASVLHFIHTQTLSFRPGLVKYECNIWLEHMSGSFQCNKLFEHVLCIFKCIKFASNKKLVFQKTLLPYGVGGITFALILLFSRLLMLRLVGRDSTGSGQMCIVPICQENDSYA